MNRRGNLARNCVLLIVSLTILATHAQAQFLELTHRVPSTANALVVFNVEKIHKSPKAAAEGWRKDHKKRFEAGLSVVPPLATRFLLASQIDFELMTPSWEISVFDLAKEPSMTRVASRHHGKVDSIDGLVAAAIPPDTYLVKFGPKTVGAMSPANRQSVARWARQAKSQTTSTLSPYLQEAVGYADRAGTEIIMALDLSDVLSPAIVSGRVNSLETLANRNIDVEKLTDLLCSIRGVTLGIRIGKQPFGKLKVDFQHDVSMMAEFAKPMLLEILANNGATIDEFDDWKAKAAGSQVSIEGHLTRNGLERILSLVNPPRSSIGSSEPEGQDYQSPGDAPSTAESSQQYFKAITGKLRSLGSQTKSAKTISQVGVWLDQYARKIDRLPILGVDGDLLDYGKWVADQLRNASAAVKGIGIQSWARQRQIYGSSASVSGWRGSAYAWTDASRGREYGTERERRAVRSEEKAAGATSAQEIMRNVDSETAGIRRKMTEKYEVEF